MLYIDKLSGSYLRWITVVLLFAFSLSIGSCQLDLLDSDMLNISDNLTNYDGLIIEYNKLMDISSVDTRKYFLLRQRPNGSIQ